MWKNIVEADRPQMKIYREFGKSLCTRLQYIVITHTRLMN